MKITKIEENAFAVLTYRNAGRDGMPHRTDLPLVWGEVDALPGTMAALVVAADLQGREDGPADRLLGLALVEKLLGLAQAGTLPEPKSVGVILAGDLYGVPGSSKRGGGGDVSEVWRAFAENFRWVAGVLGNHDSLEEALPANARVLDGDVIKRDGLRIAGLSGIIGSPERPHRRKAEAFTEWVELLAAERPDLLVLHQGPDRRPDPDPSVAQALCRGRDLLVVCGHSPWRNPLLDLAGNNQVLNVDGRVVVLRRPDMT